MDIQSYIKNAVAANRAKTLSESDQLTLGEIILKLEAIQKEGYRLSDGTEPDVVYDFEYLFPTEIDSWRGSYNELALNYNIDGTPMELTPFIELLKSAVGKEFEGYKGGEFLMSRHTPVWVANYGNSGSTAIIDIICNSYQVVIITGYRKF